MLHSIICNICEVFYKYLICNNLDHVWIRSVSDIHGAWLTLIKFHLCLFQNSSAIDLTDKMIIDLKDPNRPCFTKQEVRDMLFERNELKANLFLVKEELAYYQRWDQTYASNSVISCHLTPFEHTCLCSSGKSWMTRDVQDFYSMLCAPPLRNRELSSRRRCSAYLLANAARTLASCIVTLL